MGGDRHAVVAPRPTPGTVLWVVLGVAAPIGFLAVFFAYPVGRMLGLGLDGGAALEVLTRDRTIRILGLTVAQAAISAVACTLIGLPIAHVLYRLRFRGQGVLRALVIVPFVMPTVVVGLAFRILLRDTPLDGTFGAILLALVFFNVAVVVRTVGASWQGLDPRQEEAARSLGAGPARVFATVTLPRLLPSIVSAASIVFLFCATAFGVVLVLGGTRFGTIETEIWLLTTQFLDLRGAAVLGLVQLVVVVLLLALAARARSVPQRRAFRHRRTTWADAPAIVFSVVVAALLALPIVTLVIRSLETREGWGLGNYLALAGTGTRNALAIPVWQALLNSLAFAAAATLIAMMIGLCASILLSRRPRSGLLKRGIELVDGALMLPLGVSAVTVGFGFLIALNAPPLDLRSSPVLVPIAQALVAVPLVVRTVLPVLRGIDGRMRESAATLGSPPWRVVASIDLGIAARPILAATGLAFAVSLGEFGATTFLSRPDQATLPVVIHRLVGLPGGDNLGMAVAASVVLSALTVAIIALVERSRPSTIGGF